MRKRKTPMVSVKDRIERQRTRLREKQALRQIKRDRRPDKTSFPFMRIGNPDFGCPYHGKDRFSGMWKKAADRIFKMDGGRMFCVPYQNSKY